MIILALLVVLFFSISSISAQSVNNSDGLDKNILKSDSSSNKAVANITSKAKTNSTKTKSTNKTSTTKKSAIKTKANTTTVNKKTLAKTSTSFMNYVEKNGKFPNRKFIDKNKRAPNWVSSSKGNIPYNQLILSYSKCLDFFNKNNRLPNTIKLDDLDLNKINSKIKKNAKSSNKTANKTKSNTLKSNATKATNKTATSTVKATNKTKSTANSSSNNENNSVKEGGLVEMTLNNIHSILNNILDKLDPSKYKVDLTKSDEANLKFNTSKINVDINGKSTVNVKVSAKNTTKSTKATTTKTTASTKKTNNTKASVSKTATKTVSSSKTPLSEALRKYLTSTKNCQVKNKDIQDLAIPYKH